MAVARPLDNPNPTIFEVPKSSFRQSENVSLWIDDANDAEEEDSPIDSQEIFGKSMVSSSADNEIFQT